jgi:copper resistance protein B
MKALALLLILPFSTFAAEHEHGAAAVQPDHTVMMEHGGTLQSFLLVNRFEQQHIDGDDTAIWDAQAWYGGDYNKLWLKSEGEWNSGQRSLESHELQVLFSHAIAPFWDVQAGLQHSAGPDASRSHAVLGVQGLAPYWFDVDASALISERGDVQLRFATEYDLRLTQRLLLQPRLELNHAFNDDAPAGIEKGLIGSSVGLRLRYEFIREFAPYIGVEREVGNHRQPDATRLVAGFRVWY